VHTSEYLRVIKPVPGIENCRFRPIVRSIDKVQINLSPLQIKLAKHIVKKMIREIQPQSTLAINLNQGGQNKSRFAATPEANMQQSSGINSH